MFLPCQSLQTWQADRQESTVQSEGALLQGRCRAQQTGFGRFSTSAGRQEGFTVLPLSACPGVSVPYCMPLCRRRTSFEVTEFHISTGQESGRGAECWQNARVSHCS